MTPLTMFIIAQMVLNPHRFVTATPPPSTGSILQQDGVSVIMQQDGVSKILVQFPVSASRILQQDNAFILQQDGTSKIQK